MLCNCNCKVIFVLVMFFLTHSLWANLATVSDLKMPSTNRALKPGKGGNSPGVLGVDPEPEVASSMDCSGRTSSSSFNKEDPDKVLDLFKSLWYQELLSTSAESSSSLSSTAAWRLKSKEKNNWKIWIRRIFHHNVKPKTEIQKLKVGYIRRKYLVSF